MSHRCLAAVLTVIAVVALAPVFAAAQATVAGIENTHMIRKGQLADNGSTAFQQFAALAG